MTPQNRSIATARVALPLYSEKLTSSLITFITVALLVVAIRTTFLRKNLTNKAGNPIPPSPLLRYAFLRRYPEKVLFKWAKKYGPIYSVWMGNQLFVVINDPRVARDLLVVNGAIFSSRWDYFMKNTTILRGGAITGSKYNDTWRKHRKIAMWLLNTKAVDAFTDTIDYETHILASSLYSESRKGEVPVNPARFAGRFALNMMLTLALGTRTPSASDPLVVEAIRLGMEFMQLTGPWTNATDFIKILQFFPTTARSRAQKLHSDFLNIYGALIQRVKKSLEAGEELSDCLVKTMLLCQEEEKLTWEDMCFIFIAFTTGGVHSTSGIIEWFLALMPSHPHIAAKAHEELDRVVGRDTWPTAADESKLPYCRAILKEVLRVHAPFWMGTPHCSDEDFVYNGYFIPKNTVMILNVYALHHDEERYPDPWSFNPERYLGDELSASESAKQGDPQSRDHWAFGAGRRLCPAIVIAERELFLSISRLLWSFNFDSVPGEPISLNEYEGLSGRTPMPFRVSLTPRHRNVHEVLGEVDEVNSAVFQVEL